MSERSRCERILVLLMRLSGAVTLMAFPTMLLPTAWMAAAHEWLGMGAFPESALVDYLTRSIAALYGFHGALLLLVSCNVRRYRPIVVFLAAMYLIFGVTLLFVDLHAGMPWYWTYGEWPPLILLGVVWLVLLRGVPEE